MLRTERDGFAARGGGGGTSILKVTGTCRWTGYDGTGYLNRPNWLLAGYSVYHRVASQGFPAHNVYDRPAIWAPATVQYGDRVCIWTFLVRYIVTGCIFCAPSGLRQGQVFDPQRHPPPVHMKVECPPPPPGFAVEFGLQNIVNVCNQVALPLMHE